MAISRRMRFLGALVASSALSYGCHDTITGPRENPPPTPTPGPSTDLTGTWNGMVQRRPLDECGGNARTSIVEVHQTGGQVTFDLGVPGGCSSGGTAHFSGTLSGSALDGIVELRNEDCVRQGQLHGTVESTSMVINGVLLGTCDRIAFHAEFTR